MLNEHEVRDVKAHDWDIAPSMSGVCCLEFFPTDKCNSVASCLLSHFCKEEYLGIPLVLRFHLLLSILASSEDCRMLSVFDLLYKFP